MPHASYCLAHAQHCALTRVALAMNEARCTGLD
jgi:hypothetical protein